MFELIIGIAIGAAFSPFWMMVWERIKKLLESSKTDK